MHLNDLANIGQIVGAIAVVISLIYVALQIRQNTKCNSRRHCAICPRTFCQLVQLLCSRRVPFADRDQRIKGLRIVIGGGQGSLRRGLHGVPLLFSKRVFEMATGAFGTIALVRLEQVIMNLVCAPGGKAFWKERSYLFGEEFRRHVEDDLMKRTPHPEAKPMGAFSIARQPH